MATWIRGQMVEIDGLLAVVVGTDEESWVPEAQVAVWFGDPNRVRISEGGSGGIRPEVWLVPAENCEPAVAPTVLH